MSTNLLPDLKAGSDEVHFMVRLVHIRPRSMREFAGTDSSRLRFGGWNIDIAAAIAKWGRHWARDHNTQECWRHEEIDKMVSYHHNEYQNIEIKLFPVSQIRVGHASYELSIRMLKEMAERACLGQKILFNIVGLYGFNSLLLAHLAKRRLRKLPLVFTHTELSVSLRGIRGLVRRKLVRRLGDRSTLFIVGTEAERLSLRNVIPQCRVEYLDSVGGVDTDTFRPVRGAREALGLPEKARMILYAATFLSHGKGFDLAVRVYESMRSRHGDDVAFVALGRYNSSDPWVQKAQKLGATLPGFLPRNRLPLFYSAADVLLYPTRLVEELDAGMVCRESLACGTPVVGSTLKIVIDKEQDLREVGFNASAFPDYLEGTEKVLYEWGEREYACRRVAKEYFSWESKVPKLLRIYEGAIA